LAEEGRDARLKEDVDARVHALAKHLSSVSRACLGCGWGVVSEAGAS
jgi:hypothetical protein